jgi:hypothetical protein
MEHHPRLVRGLLGMNVTTWCHMHGIIVKGTMSLPFPHNFYSLFLTAKVRYVRTYPYIAWGRRYLSINMKVCIPYVCTQVCMYICTSR